MAVTLTNTPARISSASATSHSPSLGFTPTAGRLLVVYWHTASGTVTFTTVDPDWTLINDNTNATRVHGCGWAYRISDGTETAFTLDLSSSQSVVFGFLEFSGLAGSAVLDQSAESTANQNSISATSASTGTTATLSVSDGYALQFYSCDGQSGWDTGRSFTNGSTELYDDFNGGGTSSPGAIIGYKVLSSTTGFSETISTTDAGDGMYGSVAVFKQAGGASHAATGALTAQSATVAGSATAVTTFTSSGALSAQAATVAGTANHVVTHASSGVLEAQAATVAGSATRVVVHGSTGVLEAQAATVSGSADHSAAGAFSATGALSAQAATVAGSAAHLTLHAATGALVADSATAAGSAVHYTLHTATGDLVADASSISGSALHTGDGAEVSKPFTGAGRPRKTRQRVVVEIDGEDFIAESPEEAQAILDQAKEAAEEKAKVAIERATKARNRPTRKVMADARKALELPAISAPDLGGYAEEISRQIEDIYRSAIQTIEVSALLRKRELEEEDDEDILMLL